MAHVPRFLGITGEATPGGPCARLVFPQPKRNLSTPGSTAVGVAPLHESACQVFRYLRTKSTFTEEYYLTAFRRFCILLPWQQLTV
jgi:hypothetical protein